mmetsp:Transcript_29757/g.46706  ORF Transcript_29757/g.46706 Transcript_29757/m.46706 type:complete len:108 (+) Transcript_29757:85-408(+)|eukprot:CAMPEP_0184288738 /NCGR_PEP_ID=MMETSP1049-20130417/1198_1 /TAXON_ID=77928 /ORGANISM="Proteomonas sulcata, Strain CCMP704" /LENGTH=107 /DNA_ID=CAMNT_0026595245 /DNA_START=89 /DNA_END=412 /DNA_ORIENTATION=-
MAMTENSGLADPTAWKPERWLDRHGNLLPDHEKAATPLLGFGGGVRVCPGKRMAEVELLTMTAQMLYRFKNIEAAAPLEQIRTRQGLSVYPSPLNLKFTPATLNPTP